MSRKFVKIGESNGKIYVSGLADRSYRSYNCVCIVCGHEFVASGQDVFKYSDTGCGECRKKQRSEFRLLDARKYIGQKFGMLEIIDIPGVKHIYGRKQVMATCRCYKCGDIADYVLKKVKSGEVKQCKKCSLSALKNGHEISQVAHVDGTSVIMIDGRRKTNKNSTTGHTGVSFYPKSGKYRAYITFQRKQYHLGIYDDLNDAVSARKEAEQKIYGDFLKWYAETYPESYKKLQQ